MGKEISKKCETYKVKLSPSGEIKIPKPIIQRLGLGSGSVAELKTWNNELLIKLEKSKKKGKIDKIAKSLKLDSEIVDELIEKEDLFEPEGY